MVDPKSAAPPVAVGRPHRRAVIEVGATLTVLAVSALLGGCSNDKPAITPQNQATSDAILQRDCASPEWKKENLGLWYSVCRKPVSNW